jgi:hypothetical protein
MNWVSWGVPGMATAKLCTKFTGGIGVFTIFAAAHVSAGTVVDYSFNDTNLLDGTAENFPLHPHKLFVCA